jgi:hypothetical protein
MITRADSNGGNENYPYVVYSAVARTDRTGPNHPTPESGHKILVTFISYKVWNLL